MVVVAFPRFNGSPEAEFIQGGKPKSLSPTPPMKIIIIIINLIFNNSKKKKKS